jgi:myo-inositol-1(or 4)-monophosphatase
MSIKAFLSSSFADEDNLIVNKFIEILKENEVECYQARFEPTLPEGIIKAIKENELFVAILTPRNENAPSSYVNFEIPIAIGTGRKVIIFRQMEVPIQEPYSYRNQVEFNRVLLLSDDISEKNKISNALRIHLVRYGLYKGPENNDLKKRYEFALNHAQSLGSEILKFFNDVLRNNEIRNHEVKNFPTEADKKANRIILNSIENDSLTWDDGIISEESVNDPLEDIITKKEFVWIIDPLDGTMNFAYGFPFFCVSLGLLHNGKPTIGILYNPTTQELYSGRVGYPSECIDLKTGKKHILDIKNTKELLKNCIVMTHLSSDKEPRKKTIDVLDSIAEECRTIRILGSGQMAILSIVLGQFDIFFNYRTNIWDIIPAYVILNGAGGYLTSSLDGHEWNWRSRGVIAAANSAIGEEFRKLLRIKITDPKFPQYHNINNR